MRPASCPETRNRCPSRQVEHDETSIYEAYLSTCAEVAHESPLLEVDLLDVAPLVPLGGKRLGAVVKVASERAPGLRVGTAKK